MMGRTKQTARASLGSSSFGYVSGLGETHAITSTPAQDEPGPRLWSGNATEPHPEDVQPAMVRNVPPDKGKSNTWMWGLLLIALSRRNRKR